RGLDAFTEFSRTAVVAVSVPLMLLAGIATYFNSRASVARQSPEAAANPQTAMMNKLALYVFPLGVIVGGPFLPIAIIIYWVSNNIWTFGQQHYVFGKIEQEEEAKREEALARRSANAPAPGVKPTKRKPTPPAANGAAEPVDGTDATGSAADQNGDAAPDSGADAPTRTPRPGARPKKRKR
ncbi:MAG TPA: YidC/Oxa1 family membrane protein insertase, partial [Mycobacterium sp.]|nr:YidC/Oxa1 family membrane protein insertase [Mycobacterium sp.]